MTGTGPMGTVTGTFGPAGAGGYKARAGYADVGVWDSETDYERFRDDRLMPALRGLGRALQVIEKWPATETVRILHVT